MKIRIRKKSTAEWFCVFLLIMLFFLPTLIELLHFPSMIRYILDLIWIYLLACILKRVTGSMSRDTQRLISVVCLFFFLGGISFLANLQSPLYLLWGFRNNARFFVFFFACVFYVHPKTAKIYMDFGEKLFWLNALVVLFQYVVLGYKQDYLGGIFGVERGCNGYTNLFLVIMASKAILEALTKRRSMRNRLLIILVSLVIAVLSELKAFIIELLIILFLASTITGVSVKKIWILLILGMAALVGGIAIGRIFPDFEDWFRWSRVLDIVSSDIGYTSSGDMNRMTAIPISLKRFLPSLWEKIFGLGLGNCDYASFAALQTPFYRTNSAMNYVWFSTAFLILETGIIGLALYLSFFVLLYFMARKKRKQKQGNILYAQLAEIMAIMSIIQVFYGGTMRIEAAFMVYFVLALPFSEKELAERLRKGIDSKFVEANDNE